MQQRKHPCTGLLFGPDALQHTAGREDPGLKHGSCCSFAGFPIFAASTWRRPSATWLKSGVPGVGEDTWVWAEHGTAGCSGFKWSKMVFKTLWGNGRACISVYKGAEYQQEDHALEALRVLHITHSTHKCRTPLNPTPKRHARHTSAFHP